MKKDIEIILNFRKLLLGRIESLSHEQLNAIPPHFNNNIAWNIAHMTAVLQSLCYRSSGREMIIAEDMFLLYMPGTRPAGPESEERIFLIKKQFIETVEQLQKDIDAGVFSFYHKHEKIERVYNIRIESIEDATRYITHHDGIHYNAVNTLVRLVS